MKSVAIGTVAALGLAAAASLPAAAGPSTSAAGVTTAGVAAWHPVAARPGRHGARPPAVRHGTRPVSTTRLVVRAVYASPLTQGVPATAYTVRGVRLAPVDHSWARAEIVPKNPDAYDPATAVLHRTGGRWRVADLGTFQVGCQVAPARVLTHLGIACG